MVDKRRKLFLILLVVFIVIAMVALAVLKDRGFFGTKAASADYDIFNKPLFSLITGDTIPTDAEKIASVETRAAQGEYEPVSFSIYAKRNLTNFTAIAPDLVGPGGNLIDKSNLDIRVVKVIDQSKDYRWKEGWPVLPSQEYLLKDDTQNIFPGNWSMPGNLPDLNLAGNAKANISSGKSKQFWLTIKVPESTPAGTYNGSITLQADGINQATLPISVEVLPFALVDSTKIDRILGIYYPYTFISPTGSGASQSVITEDLFKKQLKDIRDHGLNSIMVTLWNADDTGVQRTLADLKEAGFANPKNNSIILSGWRQDEGSPTDRPIIARNIQAAQQLGFTPYYLAGDEPRNEPGASQASQQKLEDFCVRSNLIKNQGGKTTVPIFKEWADIFNQPYQFPACGYFSPGTYNASVDMPIYSTGDPTGHPAVFDYIRGLQNGTITKNNKNELYYWQLWRPQRALANRLLYGFNLKESRLNGVYPFTYQDPANYGNPYDDFDKAATDEYSYSYYGVTYPLKNDILATLNWEAVREGIDDFRYYKTLLNDIYQAKIDHPQSIALLNQIEQELQDQMQIYQTISEAPTIDPSQTIATRTFLQDKIVQVLQLSNAEITKTVDKTKAGRGQILTYTITYHNSGTSAIANAKIEDNIPSGTTFVSANSGGYLSGTKVIWNLGTVAADATRTVSFRVRIN